MEVVSVEVVDEYNLNPEEEDSFGIKEYVYRCVTCQHVFKVKV